MFLFPSSSSQMAMAEQTNVGLTETSVSTSSEEGNRSDDDAVKCVFAGPVEEILPNQTATSFWWSQHRQLFREMFAECIGTFIIVQFGCSAAMSAIYDGALVGLFQIAAIWIIAVMVAIETTASVSGAHLNPAITIAFALLRPTTSGPFNRSKILPYIGSQVMGAFLAAGINYLLYKEKISDFEAANNIVRGTPESIASAKTFGEYYLDPVSTATAFMTELYATAALAFVVFALTNAKNNSNKALTSTLIGLTVGALVSIIAPITQCGINPARDFGPRIMAYLAGWDTVAFQGWWVYVFAPIIGAPIGAFVADELLYGGRENDPKNLTLPVAVDDEGKRQAQDKTIEV